MAGILCSCNNVIHLCYTLLNRRADVIMEQVNIGTNMADCQQLITAECYFVLLKVHAETVTLSNILSSSLVSYRAGDRH